MRTRLASLLLAVALGLGLLASSAAPTPAGVLLSSPAAAQASPGDCDASLFDLPGQVTCLAQSLWNTMYDIGSDIVSGIVSGVSGALDVVRWSVDWVRVAVDNVASTVSDIGADITAWLSDVVASIGDMAIDVTNKLGDVISTIVDNLAALGTRIVDAISTGLLLVLTGLQNVFQAMADAWDGLTSAVQTMRDMIVSTLENVWNTLLDLPSNLWTFISEGLRELFIPNEDWLFENMGALMEKFDSGPGGTLVAAFNAPAVFVAAIQGSVSSSCPGGMTVAGSTFNFCTAVSAGYASSPVWGGIRTALGAVFVGTCLLGLLRTFSRLSEH